MDIAICHNYCDNNRGVEVLLVGHVPGLAMDIVAQLRQEDDELMQKAADTIEFLRTQLARANCPVVDSRNSDKWRPPECNGFQGFED